MTGSLKLIINNLRFNPEDSQVTISAPFAVLLNQGTVPSPPNVHVIAFSRSSMNLVRLEQSETWLSM